MQHKQTLTQNTEPTCMITIGNKTETTPFETLLTQALDETFTTLGVKQQFYNHLKTKYRLHPWQTAENLDVFTAALNEIFGDASPLVELKIISQLHSKTPKTRYRLNGGEELTLCGYIKNLKASFS